MHQSLYNVSWAEGAFSPAECDTILAQYGSAPLRPGLLIQSPGIAEANDTAVRKSSICNIAQDAGSAWIYQRLQHVAALVNQELKFDLRGFDEGIQMARYTEGEFYHWHADLGADVSAYRKLSLVVQLTSPADYDGGEVEFFPTAVHAPKTRGTITVFPAYIPHRVLPVRRGPRWSLAAWAAGATPFR